MSRYAFAGSWTWNCLSAPTYWTILYRSITFFTVVSAYARQCYSVLWDGFTTSSSHGYWDTNTEGQDVDTICKSNTSKGLDIYYQREGDGSKCWKIRKIFVDPTISSENFSQTPSTNPIIFKDPFLFHHVYRLDNFGAILLFFYRPHYWSTKNFRTPPGIPQIIIVDPPTFDPSPSFRL